MAALRAIRWIAIKTIRVGGRLVTLLAPSSPVEQPIPDDVGHEDIRSSTAERDNRYARIQELARELIRNPETPPTSVVRGVDPLAAIWLATMPHEMLVRVSLASEEALADHIAGRRSIEGVLSYDGDSVRDYQRVTEMPESQQAHGSQLTNALCM